MSVSNVTEIRRSILVTPLTIDELNMITEAIRHKREAIAYRNRVNLRAGDAVKFDSKKLGFGIRGSIIKVARKRATVSTERNGIWVVPLSMLTLTERWVA